MLPRHKGIRRGTLHLDSEMHRPHRPRQSFRRRKTSKPGTFCAVDNAVDTARAGDNNPPAGDSGVWYRPQETPANQDLTGGAVDAVDTSPGPALNARRCENMLPGQGVRPQDSRVAQSHPELPLS